MFSYIPPQTSRPSSSSSSSSFHSGSEKQEGHDDIKLEELFNHGRVKQDTSLLIKFLFLCYLPLGIVILATRLILFLVLSVSILVLPRSIGDSINMPLMRIVCGLVVRHNNEDRNKPLLNEPHIIAANHVADFDTFASWVVLPKFHTLTAAHLKSIPFIGSVYARLNAIFVTPTPEGRAEVKAKVNEILESDPAPILIFPEGGLTNGRVGTMMYHRFVFSLDCSIIPMAVALKDPWPVYHDYLGSTWTRNFIWFLLVPFHIFEVTLLSPERRKVEETPEEFALRVQQITCDYLDIEATQWPYSAKKELWKQISTSRKKNV